MKETIERSELSTQRYREPKIHLAIKRKEGRNKWPIKRVFSSLQPLKVDAAAPLFLSLGRQKKKSFHRK